MAKNKLKQKGFYFDPKVDEEILDYIETKRTEKIRNASQLIREALLLHMRIDKGEIFITDSNTAQTLQNKNNTSINNIESPNKKQMSNEPKQESIKKDTKEKSKEKDENVGTIEDVKNILECCNIGSF